LDPIRLVQVERNGLQLRPGVAARQSCAGMFAAPHQHRDCDDKKQQRSATFHLMNGLNDVSNT
jgi:hypothetical protein